MSHYREKGILSLKVKGNRPTFINIINNGLLYNVHPAASKVTLISLVLKRKGKGTKIKKL